MCGENEARTNITEMRLHQVHLTCLLQPFNILGFTQIQDRKIIFFFPVFSQKKIQILGDLAGSEGVPLLTVPSQASSQLENSLMKCGNLNLILLLDSYLQYLWSTAEQREEKAEYSPRLYHRPEQARQSAFLRVTVLGCPQTLAHVTTAI